MERRARGEEESGSTRGSKKKSGLNGNRVNHVFFFFFLIFSVLERLVFGCLHSDGQPRRKVDEIAEKTVLILVFDFLKSFRSLFLVILGFLYFV